MESDRRVRYSWKTVWCRVLLDHPGCFGATIFVSVASLQRRQSIKIIAHCVALQTPPHQQNPRLHGDLSGRPALGRRWWRGNAQGDNHAAAHASKPGSYAGAHSRLTTRRAGWFLTRARWSWQGDDVICAAATETAKFSFRDFAATLHSRLLNALGENGLVACPDTSVRTFRPCVFSVLGIWNTEAHSRREPFAIVLIVASHTFYQQARHSRMRSLRTPPSVNAVDGRPPTPAKWCSTAQPLIITSWCLARLLLNVWRRNKRFRL